jgi:hypothetical protein
LICRGYGGIVKEEHYVARLAWTLGALSPPGSRKAGDDLLLIILENLEFLDVQIVDVFPFLVCGNDVDEHKVRFRFDDLRGGGSNLGIDALRSSGLGRGESKPEPQRSNYRQQEHG